jgi:hypothetical protein
LQKQKTTKVHMEKVEVRKTKNGKGRGLFAFAGNVRFLNVEKMVESTDTCVLA